MNEFLDSVKADLTDRRLLPIVGLVLVALVAAVAYAVLGGGSSAAKPVPTAAPSGPAAAASGLSVSQSTPEKSVAEMTSGVSKQKHGSARNPFTPLPEANAKSATASGSVPGSGAGGASSSASAGGSSAGAGSSSSPSSSSGSGSSSSGSGESSPGTPSKPSKPAPSKPTDVYRVAVLFGVAASSSPLTPYENLKLMTPLPSASQALVVYRGVTAAGKSATFTLVGEAILHGEANCLPSASQCEAIDLKPGQSEQLEVQSATGAVTYELKLVTITSSKASGAAVKDALRHESRAGRELLGRAGLLSIPYLHYSALSGVLVFDAHRAFGAHSHAARAHHSG